MLERAVGVLIDIAAAGNDGQPLAITHAGFIRTLLREIGLADAPVAHLTGWTFDVTGDDVVPVEAFDPRAGTIDRRSTTPTLG